MLLSRASFCLLSVSSAFCDSLTRAASEESFLLLKLSGVAVLLLEIFVFLLELLVFLSINVVTHSNLIFP